MRKCLCVLLCLVLAVRCCPGLGEMSAPAAETESVQMEKKPLPLYFEDKGLVQEAFPVYYETGVDDLPYVDVMEWVGAMNEIDLAYGAEQGSYSIREDKELGWLVLTDVANDSVVLISFAENSVTFFNFDSFGVQNKGSHLDILSLPRVNAQTGEYELIAQVMELQTERGGESRTIDMKHYDIPMYMQDGHYFMPLHTVFDLFACIASGVVCVCNNEAIFIGSKDMFVTAGADPETGETVRMLSELGEICYSAPQKPRSEKLAWYGASELCMELDCFYGLKESHNISDFDSLLLQTDYFQRILNSDAAVADAALQDFINYYLDDLHSDYRMNSYLTGANTELPTGQGFSARADSMNGQLYNQVLRTHQPEGLPAYQEVGNTAYVTFNSFTMVHDPDYYYQLDLDDQDCIDDTVSLIAFAHHQITRENSPIENVVLDLSLNGGGRADAAIYVISWFLGEAAITNVDTFTDAQRSGVYVTDVNMDYDFNMDDWLLYKYNLYCLVSPYSFSCGNLVPWAFKANGAVTLIGRATGGGSCLVQAMSTAWGTIYQMSGFKRLAFVKNGSFYDVDRGVEPDVVLTKLNSFYDRNVLTDIINGLY